MPSSVPQYPHLPHNRTFSFVSLTHPMMQAARDAAKQKSGCSWWQTGAVIVKDGTILGRGANEGQWQPLCPRYEQGCGTGEGYELCKNICKQTGHAETTAIDDCLGQNNNPAHADLYLFGHWWCCENCWNTIIHHNISTVFLLKDAHTIFTRESRTRVKERIKTAIQKGETIEKNDVFWHI